MKICKLNQFCQRHQFSLASLANYLLHESIQHKLHQNIQGLGKMDNLDKHESHNAP